MTERIQVDLAAIEDGLVRLGRQPTVAALSPGIPAELVRQILSREGFRSNRALEAWFGWHNGTSDLLIDSSQVFIGYYPLSLDEAIQVARTYRDLDSWDANWLPFLADGGGYFYVEDQSSPESEPVRCYRYDQANHPIEYQSLDTFVASIAEGYRAGAFYVHPGGYLAPKMPNYERIAARLNPGVAWWDSLRLMERPQSTGPQTWTRGGAS